MVVGFGFPLASKEQDRLHVCWHLDRGAGTGTKTKVAFSKKQPGDASGERTSPDTYSNVRPFLGARSTLMPGPS